jgi:hypothetical protein
MRRWTRHLPRAALATALAALATAACTDRTPTGARPGPEGPAGPTGPGAEPVTLQALQCEGNRRTLRIACTPLDPHPEGGAAANIIVGGQNLYVSVIATNAAYNDVTGRFTFDVTLQNLIEQPMGTIDGETHAADPGGIKIFFHSGPNVLTGTGVASVLPDGFGTFTAEGQPYYQHDAVLEQNETSPAKTWTLVMPPTVLTFDFILYVSTPVPWPNGYVTLDGQLPDSYYGDLHPGDTHLPLVEVKSRVGAVVPGAVVTFGTSDPYCATVSAAGVVKAVRAQTCAITATSGTRPGGMEYDVTGTVRTWDGSVSASWGTGGNWVRGLVPAPVDSVLIPAGTPNQPALVGDTYIGGVEVEDGATLSLGAFTLTASADVATGATPGSGVLAAGGRLALAGTGTVRGRVPSFLVTGGYALSGALAATAPEDVDAGTLESDQHELTIDAQ